MAHANFANSDFANIVVGIVEGFPNDRAAEESMTFKRGSNRGLTLLGFLVLGLGLVFVPHYWKWTWDFGITSEIGVAFLVASILGFTIDRWLKADIAADVFKAAIGHVLPEEFRPEVARIIGYKMICERHALFVEITKAGNESVKVQTSLERTIRNRSAYSEKIANFIHIDEWGRTVGKSKILECALEINGEIFEGTKQPNEKKRIKMQTEETTLQPGHVAKLRSKWVEYKSLNDSIYYHFSNPTINPEIEVGESEEFECSINFGTAEQHVEKFHFKNKRQLLGTYFPHQHMSVRWLPNTRKS